MTINQTNVTNYSVSARCRFSIFEQHGLAGRARHAALSRATGLWAAAHEAAADRGLGHIARLRGLRLVPEAPAPALLDPRGPHSRGPLSSLWPSSGMLHPDWTVPRGTVLILSLKKSDKQKVHPNQTVLTFLMARSTNSREAAPLPGVVRYIFVYNWMFNFTLPSINT